MNAQVGDNPSDALAREERDAIEAGADPWPEIAAGNPPHPVDTAIDRWFFEHFHGTALARNTECWNIVHKAKPALKALMRNLAGG